MNYKILVTVTLMSQIAINGSAVSSAMQVLDARHVQSGSLGQPQHFFASTTASTEGSFLSSHLDGAFNGSEIDQLRRRVQQLEIRANHSAATVSQLTEKVDHLAQTVDQSVTIVNRLAREQVESERIRAALMAHYIDFQGIITTLVTESDLVHQRLLNQQAFNARCTQSFHILLDALMAAQQRISRLEQSSRSR